MTERRNTSPGQTPSRPANLCRSLQAGAKLAVRYRQPYRANLPSGNSPEEDKSGYSSPVCYAHLQGFREGFE